MDKPTANLKRPAWERRKWPWAVLAAAGVIIFLLLLNHYYQWYPWPWRERQTTASRKIYEQAVKPKPSRIIDYNKVKQGAAQTETKELTKERKEKFGLKKSVDMIVKSGETIRIGKEVIPLNQILAEIEAQKTGKKPSIEAFLRKPAIKEKEIHLSGNLTAASVGTKLKQSLRYGLAAKPGPPEAPTVSDSIETGPVKRPKSYYGVYVVRPGDNLWNIHFAFLREYLGSKGIVISPDADEPLGKRSSGVGRILKYAEGMVYIFNLKTKQLSGDLNLLEPQEKVVIFNLTLLDRILGSLTAEELKLIHFDGRDLILPD